MKSLASERRSARAANLAFGRGEAERPDECALRRSGDGSVKRNSALVRRVRTTLGEDACGALLAEVPLLNSTQFVPELAAAVADARLPRAADVVAAVRFCGALHARYEDFSAALSAALVRQFRESLSAPEAQRATRQRTLVRLMLELLLWGVCADPSPPLSAFRELVRADLQQQQQSLAFANLPLVLAFVRSGASDVFGIERDGENDGGDAASAAAAAASGGRVVSAEQAEAMRKIVRTYFERLSAHLCERHEELQAREAEQREVLQTKGELPDAMQSAYDALRKAYEKLVANATALADVLQMQMPALPEARSVTRIAGEITLAQPTRGSGSDIMAEDPVWDSEESKAFYTELPDLESVPDALLHGESGDKDDTEDAPTVSVAAPSSVIASSELTSAVVSALPTIQTLLQKLPQCLSTEMVDKAAEEFAYVNRKRNRTRLVSALFSAPATRLDLLPYYARLAATLSRHVKDIGEALVEKLQSEFHQLERKKSQTDLDERIRNIRFLAELVKFRVCPRNIIFDCFQACLDDFSHHNIDVACTLIEHCGRFLYRTPETHIRFKNMLDVTMRLKKALHLDPRMEALVENAYYFCVPSESSLRRGKTRTPVQEYIRFLLFKELSKKSATMVVRQLRKLNWAEQEDYLVHCILRVHKARFGNVSLVAGVVAALASYHTSLSVKVVDALMEEIIVGLERNEPSMQQKRIAHAKLFAELYNYFVVDTNLLFDTLYLLLTYAHDPRSTSSGLAARLDGPADCFRIRLVCTILDACGHCFSKASKRLDKFLVLFQRYVLSKEELPADVVFALDDCFDGIRPGQKRLLTLEEANAAVEELFAAEQARMPQQSPGVQDAPQPAEQDEEESEPEPEQPQLSDGESDDEDEEEDDDDEEEESSSDEEDEDDDDDEEEEESEEEEEDEEKQEQEEESTASTADVPVDAEFDASLSKMVQESLDTARQHAILQQRRRDPLNIIIPMSLTSRPPPPSDAAMMPFTILTKKGSKQKAHEVMVPIESPLVRTHFEAVRESQQEKQEIKRLVLESLQNEEDAQAQAELGAPGTLGEAMLVARQQPPIPRGFRGRWRGSPRGGRGGWR